MTEHTPIQPPVLEPVTVVDANDCVVGAASRQEMRRSGLLHRVTYILVFNRAGQLLVQTRTDTKDWYPGLFDFAAGGVVQHGEDYTRSARRELVEELGIEVELAYQFKLYFEDRATTPVSRSWGQVYRCISDGPFKLQAEEVAAVEFMDLAQVLAINPTQVTPDSRLVLHNFLL